MSVFELLGSTSDGVFAVDRAQRIAFWNEAAQRILGFESDSVLGERCYEIVGGKDDSGCTLCGKRCTTFRASLRNELSPTQDVEADTRLGDRKWISVTTFVLPSRYHELALLAHVFRDTNEAHQLRSRLEQILQGTAVKSDPYRPPAPGNGLTPREKEVLYLLASGRSTASICNRLDVQPTTIRTHVQHILDKLGVHSRLEAVACASQNGWLKRAR